jgi:hypothetical protein
MDAASQAALVIERHAPFKKDCDGITPRCTSSSSFALVQRGSRVAKVAGYAASKRRQQRY